MSDPRAKTDFAREYFEKACNDLLQASGASGLLLGLPEPVQSVCCPGVTASLAALSAIMPAGAAGEGWRLPAGLSGFAAGQAPESAAADWLAAPLPVAEAPAGLAVFVFRPGGLAAAGLPAAVEKLTAGLRTLTGAISLSFQLAEASALQCLFEKISVGLELQPTLQAAAETVCRQFGASAAAIMLAEPSESLLLAAAAGDPSYLPDPPSLAYGSGFAGRVALRRQRIYLADTEPLAGLAGSNPAARSLLGEPLVTENTLLGTLTLVSEQTDAFGSNAPQLVSSLAASLAAFIHKDRLHSSAQQRSRELQALVELGRVLAQESNLETICKAAYDAVRSQMACEAFLIALSDAHSEATLATYMIDRDARFSAKRGNRNSGLSGYVITSGKKLRIMDLENESLEFTYAHYGTSRSVRSVAAAPLVFRQAVIGMLATQSYQPGAFSEQNLEMLAIIADFVAGAVHNASREGSAVARHPAAQPTKQSGKPQVISIRLHRQATDFLASIQAALQRMQPMADYHGLALEFDGPQTLPLLAVDPYQISQALDNILSLALKFAHPDSQIRVKLQTNSEWVTVSVLSQSDPVPLEAQIEQSQPVFSSETTLQQPDLGSELATARRIIQAHGGQVWVANASQSGICIHFTLPAGQSAPELDKNP